MDSAKMNELRANWDDLKIRQKNLREVLRFFYFAKVSLKNNKLVPVAAALSGFWILAKEGAFSLPSFRQEALKIENNNLPKKLRNFCKRARENSFLEHAAFQIARLVFSESTTSKIAFVPVFSGLNEFFVEEGHDFSFTVHVSTLFESVFGDFPQDCWQFLAPKEEQGWQEDS